MMNCSICNNNIEEFGMTEKDTLISITDKIPHNINNALFD